MAFGDAAWSFTASVIPLTLGAALAWASDAAHAGLFLLTLLGGVAVQTGTNMLNIYGDYRSGVDTEASATGNRPSSSALSAKPCGGAASSPCAWPLPWHRARVRLRLADPRLRLVGIAGGYGYTSGFWPYKYHACGPIMVFLLMGPLMALPATTSREAPLTGGPFSPPCLLRASSPASCTPTTSATSRTTARPGSRLSPCCWAAGKPVPVRGLCVGAYGVLLLLAAFGVLPLSGLLPFVLAPGLWRTLRTLGTRPLPESELVSLDGVSARHHFLFGLLLIAGILLPRGLELAQGLIRGIFA